MTAAKSVSDSASSAPAGQLGRALIDAASDRTEFRSTLYRATRQIFGHPEKIVDAVNKAGSIRLVGECHGLHSRRQSRV